MTLVNVCTSKQFKTLFSKNNNNKMKNENN